MEFAVLAIVAAALFADRIGVAGEVKRRFFQLGLAVTLLLFAIATATTLSPAESDLAFGGEEPEVIEAAKALKQQAIFLAAAGLGLLLIGFNRSTGWPTISQGLILAGILIPFVGLDFPISSLYDTSYAAGTLRNAIYTAVLGAGSLVLLIYGHKEWERTPQDVPLG